MIPSVRFSSVTQSCPTLCDPMNRSTPGLPVHHQLSEFTQTHVHRVGDTIQPSHPLSRSFHTCVKIEVPEYFHHEGKTDTLNSSQRKALVDFLKKPFDEDTSNWEYLIMTWNINGSGKRLSKKMPIPDYTKLK